MNENSLRWYPHQITQREINAASRLYDFAELKRRPTPGLQGKREFREWLGLSNKPK